MNQNQVDEYTTILSNALHNNPEVRQKAEEQIKQLANENFGLFLTNLSIKLSNEEINTQIRQIASTIIKNAISKAEYCHQWLTLNIEIKTKIKEHILSTLASSTLDIRKAAALAIAGICKVELPRNEWNDIFTILTSTSTNDSIYIQLSSLTTLSFIFQEITPGDITDDDIANLLNCFYTILNKSDGNLDVLEAALNAIENFLPFINRFIEDNNSKNLFFELIRKYITHSSSKLRHLAIEIFLELIRTFYEAFDDYLDTLTNFTICIIKQDEPCNVILCFEIWCSIGDTEIERLQYKNANKPFLGYMEKQAGKLLEVTLNKYGINDYFNDEWNEAKAVASLLSIMSQCCSYPVIQKIIEFIGVNITSDSMDKKHAALATFQAIIDSAHKKQMGELVINSLDLIFEYLNKDSHPDHIKELCGSVIKTMTQHYAENFIKDSKLFDKTITFLFASLTKHKKKVVVYICLALYELFKAVPNEENMQTNVLSKHVQMALSQLLSMAVAQGSYNYNDNVAMNCFYTIGTLIDNSALDTQQLKTAFLDQLLNAFQSTFSNDNFQNNEMRYAYQGYISFTFSYFLRTLNLSHEAVNRLLQLILDSINERKEPYETAIQTIGTIATYLGENFTYYMPQVLNLIIGIISNPSDASLCKDCIIAISDIIQAIGKEFGQYSNAIIPLILNLLSNSDTDKKLKLYSFNIISDFFLHCSMNIQPYYQTVMTLIGSALQASITNMKVIDDIDMYEYFIKLREHLVETITVIFGVLIDSNRTQDFTIYVPPIIEFIHTIHSDTYMPSFNIAKESVGLLADFCRIYGQYLKPLLNAALLEKMLKILKEESNDVVINHLINYSRQQFAQVLK